MNRNIYLDYQATTPTAEEVVRAMMPYFSDQFYNPASSNLPGVEINTVIEDCRSMIAKLINGQSHEILFTSGATEAINMAIKGLFENESDAHLITLKSEHSAVLNSCKYLERKGIHVTYLDVEEDGLVDLHKLEDAFRSNTRLVAVMHVNNEIGVIQPIEKIGRICAQKGVPLFVDAAQSFGKLNIDVKQSNISLLSISGHKIYGPKGIGALYINKKIKGRLFPLIHGGGQENGFRSGTLNVPGIVGLAKAAELSNLLMESEQERILALRNQFLNLLQERVPGVVVNGNPDQRIAGNLNLSFRNVSGDVLFNRLDDVIVSRGSACNSSKNQGSHVLKAIGLPDELADSALRISIGRYTTEEEIYIAAERISSTVNDIRKISTIA